MSVSSHGFPAVCLALALASCAAPKAIIVAETPATPANTSEKPGVRSSEEIPPLPGETPPPGQADDGFRMPDMLGLPGDGDFRPSNPDTRKSGAEPGAVISRPPTDPPSRPKPKETPAE